MYFKDRTEAGQKLARKLAAYKRENTAVIALSLSSVPVAAEIATELHGNLMVYLTRDITLPGEAKSVAAVSSTGHFSYNNLLTPGQVNEISSEFRNHIEQERFNGVHDLNILLGKDGEINKNLLRHHVVILVADALPNGFGLVMAHQFLKTVATKKVVVAAPVAEVNAVDHAHMIADELHIGAVTPNFLSIDHYYDDNKELTVGDVKDLMGNISLAWSKEPKKNSEPEAKRTPKRPKKSQMLLRPGANRNSGNTLPDFI